MYYFFILILLLHTSIIHAKSLQDQLIDLGSSCDQASITTCILPEKVLGYPNRIIFLFQKESKNTDLWIHLHGHSLGKLSSGEDFDSTPMAMIENFQLQELIAKNASTLLVIPFTIGRCLDYDNYLVSPKNFENLIIQLQNLLAQQVPVHLSAHSGGGRTLAQTINRIKTNIKSVTLFDANYNFDYVTHYTKWVNLAQKKLNLLAVAPAKVDANYQRFSGATPFNISKSIFEKILIGQERVPLEQEKSYAFNKNAKSSTFFLYQAQSSAQDHWYIVRNFFPLIMQRTLDESLQE